MNNNLDTIALFQSATDIDDLWAKMRLCLRQYGMTSAFYGVSHAINIVERHPQESIIDSIWYKTDHPKNYRDHFDNKYYIDDDLGAIHCLTNTNPFIWHDKSMWGSPTPRQEKFMLDSFDFKMGIGVTLPIRFDNFGYGGLGLCMGDMSERDFEQMWQTYSQQICAISYLFDEFMRSNHNEAIYPLSIREQEVLSWLAVGETAKSIAYKLGSTPSTVDKQIRTARQKLGARNNEQAITKAIIFKLINP